MNRTAVTIDEFSTLLEEVLQTGEALKLSSETTARDVKNWDSLNNVRLLMRIEQTYDVDLPVTEIDGIKNVGQLIDLINRCRNGSAALPEARPE